jgi:hypothetical protein
VFVMLMCMCSGVQAQDGLGYMLRTEGYALEADSLDRVVTLKMSPEWNEILRTPEGQQERKALARLLGAFVEAGVPSERAVRSLPTGFLLATLDEAKGKASLEIQIEFAPDTATRGQIRRGWERLAEAIEKTVERSSGLKLAVAFELEAETVQRSVFNERGSQVFIVLPADQGWSQTAVEHILRNR